ncbi:hypothetical protein C9I92_21195 [Photobacterium ganghwense]|uniref:Uncharacterized protein n=1 Tax=Photobacterium ganghwense TaxID=320778 RepID=A0A0J1HEP5_9GAMM|nr:hypothetical protein [Photobacterium ganghwense]KLV10083.1 hypothetical protein ABT57_05665 [Photobacterium ganghwense]PSU05316.1 hypothetical protein C9I92_21195 [Photobacterium ganghwense]
MSVIRFPKQVTKAPSGAAVSSRLTQLLKNEIRASIQLARNYRLAGERRLAAQFLNDAAESRLELLGVLHAPN